MDSDSDVSAWLRKFEEDEDDIQVLSDGGKSSKDDVEVVLDPNEYFPKETSQDLHKINLLKSINSFLSLSTSQVFDDNSLLTGKILLNRLKAWFPRMEKKFLQGISESQAVRNCQTSLAELYNSISTGPWGDHTISMESTNDIESTLSGGGMPSRFPYIRCRLTPDSLVSEQQKQKTFERANISDMLLDNLYRYAENSYLKKYQFETVCGTSGNNKNPCVSDIPTIERIDFIVHSNQIAQYEEEKEKYRSKKLLINEKLLFHGSQTTNLNKILSDTSKFTADPVNRRKANMYGKGIYLSDIPPKQLRNGEALMLCKVILGKEQVVPLGSQPLTGDKSLLKNYNSRKMVNGGDHKDGPGNIYMVPNPRQVLPCYVIYFKERKGMRNDDGMDSGDQSLPMFPKTGKSKKRDKVDIFYGKSIKRDKVDIFFVPLAPAVYPILPYLREVQEEYDKQYETLKNLRAQELKLGYDIITGHEKENLFGLGLQVSSIMAILRSTSDIFKNALFNQILISFIY